MPSVHSRSPSPAGRSGGDSKRRRTHAHRDLEPDSPNGSVSSKGRSERRDRDSGRRDRDRERERGYGVEREDKRHRDERHRSSRHRDRDYDEKEDDYNRHRSSRRRGEDEEYRSSSRREADDSRRSSRREEDDYHRRSDRDRKRSRSRERDRDYYRDRDDRRRRDKDRGSDAADAVAGSTSRSADSPENRRDRRDRDYGDDRRRGSYDQRDGRSSTRDTERPAEVSIKGLAATREANGSEDSPRAASNRSFSPPRSLPPKKAGFAPIGRSAPAPPPTAALSSAPGSAAAKARALAEAKEGRLPGESLEEQKLRMKRERLEQWKAKKQAEEAAAFAKAQEAAAKTSATHPTEAGQLNGRPNDGTGGATAAAANIAARLGTQPGGPGAGGELQKTSLPVGIKGLPARPAFNTFGGASANDAAQPNKSALAGDDDEEAEGRKIQKLNFDEIKADDEVLKLVEAEDDSDEEDLVGGGHGGYKRKGQGGGQEEEDEDEVAVVKGADEADDGGVAKMAVDEDDPVAVPAPAPTPPLRPARQTRQGAAAAAAHQEPMAVDSADEDVDPLDAFMFGVADEVKKVNAVDRQKMKQKAGGQVKKIFEDDDEEEDVKGSDEENDSMRPEDILALAAKKIKKKDLAPVDHSKIDYEPFRKAFYHPPAEVEELTEEQAENIRLAEDGIKIRGVDCPKPVMKWSWFGLHASALEVIKTLGYPAPTPIQGQAVPAIMSGRDVIGVAKTGSGKTLAFLLPMLRHIKDQRPLEQLEGPIAMIMTPTRELATQIYKEGRPFLKALNLRASCAYGGSPLKDNIADLKRGAEVCVCTPGRMIELLTTNSGRVINLRRVTYLVLDEADRMFDMGFEPQVMKIVGQIRPDRQTVLFSATFPKQMEALARKILRPQPLEITVGGRSVVAAEIEQIVEVREESTKFNRLLEIMGRFYNDDPEARTLVFVDRQESADNLFRELLKKGYPCLSLHGGKEQVDRDQVIQDFKSGVVPIVIATSVAARGLDVKQLKLVVNYDAPNHMEDYVHRAGRTGRAGNKGTCITFICPDQDRYAVDLLRALVASKASYPEELKTMSDGFLEKVKSGKAQAAGSGFGGKGLDHLERDRDAKTRAERSAYGEPTEDGARAEGEEGRPSGEAGDAPGAKMDLPELNVEVRRGPAPDSSRRGAIVRAPDANAVPALTAALNAAQTSAANATDATGASRAKAVAAELNIKLKQMVALKNAQALPGGHDNRSKDPDATDFHAVVPINDYPQKARWKVTNKETMVQLVESTGASVTNKGVFYEKGRDPGPDEPPKLHLLVESNEEWRVQRAIHEIRAILIEATTQALEAEQRNPGQTGGGGRYSVL